MGNPPTANDLRAIDKNASENKRAADAAKAALQDLKKLGAMVAKTEKELKQTPD